MILYGSVVYLTTVEGSDKPGVVREVYDEIKEDTLSRYDGDHNVKKSEFIREMNADNRKKLDEIGYESAVLFSYVSFPINYGYGEVFNEYSLLEILLALSGETVKGRYSDTATQELGTIIFVGPDYKLSGYIAIEGKDKEILWTEHSDV